MRAATTFTFVLITLISPSAAFSDPLVTFFPRGSPGDIVLPVTIAGQGPFRMLLDTGAVRSAVTRRVAERLSSRVVGETLMVTPGGDDRRPLVLLPGVTTGALGPQTVVGVQLEPVDLRDPGIDGLIGQDLLSRVAFTIDYRAGTIEWHGEGGARRGGRRVPVELGEGRLVARVRGLGGEIRLLVDSGADRLVLFARARQTLRAVDVGASGTLRSTAGTRTVSAVRIEDLLIGNVALQGVLAAVVPDTGAHPAMEDGLLPLHLFERVTVDAPARALFVQELPTSSSR
jgi:predicted aspartyl protease